MTVTVLDSSNLPAILADAGVELETPAGAENTEKSTSAAPSKEDGRAAERESSASKTPSSDDEDEDESGLTESERAELTAKMQRAIGKRVRRQREAEEFAANEYNQRRLAEERAARLEQELAELRGAQKQPEQQEAAAPEKPQRHQFATDDEYLDAMIQFGVDQRLAEKRASDEKAAAEAARQEMINAAGRRMARAIELVPDYEEVTGAVDTIVPPAIAHYMGKSEMIAELGYHLAKNPELLESLAKLPPDEQLVKIGKIESTLTPFEPKAAQNDSKSSKETPDGQAKPAPSADTEIDLSKPRGKAAPVITPLETAGSAGAAKDPKDMNIRESIEEFSRRNRTNLNLRKRH